MHETGHGEGATSVASWDWAADGDTSISTHSSQRERVGERARRRHCEIHLPTVTQWQRC